jgi:hypothetical protein
VSVHVFVSLSFHQIRLLCSNDLLVFLNIEENIIGYFTQDCQEALNHKNSLLLSAPNGLQIFFPSYNKIHPSLVPY